MKIIIIGAGISGILAYHYLKDKGNVTILEEKKSIDSYPKFTFYCHEYIDDFITAEKIRVQTEIVNKTENYIKDYGKKVYGDSVPFDLSIENCEGEKDSWILNYADLSDEIRSCKQIHLGEKVIDINPDKKVVASQIGDYSYDIIINTVYLPHIVYFMTGERFLPKYIPIRIRTSDSDCITNSVRKLHVKYYPSLSTSYYRSFDDCKFKCFEYIMTDRLIGQYEDTKWGKILYPGKIFPDEALHKKGKELEKLGLYNFGRYSEWIPKRMIHSVAKNLKKFADTL